MSMKSCNRECWGFILLDAVEQLAMDSYLQSLLEAITSATRGITTEDLTRHPEGKWSASEVLEHLYLTYTGTVKGFERCLAAGRPLASFSAQRRQLSLKLSVRLGKGESESVSCSLESSPNAYHLQLLPYPCGSSVQGINWVS